MFAERGPEDEAGEELEAGPAAEGATEEVRAAAGAEADDDADLEGALESVEEGMQGLNVDDEVISQVQKTPQIPLLALPSLGLAEYHCNLAFWGICSWLSGPVRADHAC